MWSDTLILYLLLILICLLLSAFFSGSETAFIALQRIRLKHLETSGGDRARRVARLMKKPERFLATVLLGNNFVNTAAAALATAIAVSIWEDNKAIVIATVVLTALVLVFGEIIPKTIASRHSERVALLLVRPIEWLAWLLRPFTAVLSWMGVGVARLIGETSTPRNLVSEDEIRTMISVGSEEGVMEESQATMLHKVFRFGDRPVRQAMTPRPDIVWLERGITLSNFLETYAQSPHTRYPVYQESTENVVGVLAIKDVLMAQAKGSLTPNSLIEDLIRPVSFMPESKRVGEIFGEMQLQGQQMAMVVDEHGSISGIITIEDLVEEVVGDIRDEWGEVEKDFEVIDEHTFQIDGSMRVEEANEQMKLNLPQGDYETVAGFVLSRLGHIPKVGEQIRCHGLKLTVTEIKGMRLEKILIAREGETL